MFDVEARYCSVLRNLQLAGLKPLVDGQNLLAQELKT